MSESIVEALESFLPGPVQKYKTEVEKLNIQHKKNNMNPKE